MPDSRHQVPETRQLLLAPSEGSECSQPEHPQGGPGFRRAIAHMLDKLICGEYQIPAEEFERLTEDPVKTAELMRGRRQVLGGVALGATGVGLSTYALSNPTYAPLYALATVLTVTGNITQARASNKNGSLWSMALQEKVNELGPYTSSVEAALVDAGFAEDEIHLASLHGDAYTTELNYVRLQLLQRILNPLSSAAGMVGYGDYALAAAISGIGLSGIPIGEAFYKESNVYRSAKQRAARAARHFPYLEQLAREHRSMTTRSNALRSVGDVMFATKYLIDPMGKTAASLKGIPEALGDLSAPLSFQRTRESAKRQVGITKQLIETLTSKPFIATRARYREHIAEHGVRVISNPPIHDGILVDSFKAVLPSGEETAMQPFSLSVEKGETAILRAESGTGKSITLMALLHLLEHSGSVHLVRGGSAKDIHTFESQAEIARHILFVTEEGLNGTDRIADRFRDLFEQTHQDLFQAHLKKWDRTMVEIAWRTADNLLETEIKKLEKGERAVFPARMWAVLEEVRSERNGWVQERLRRQDGNLARKRITPQRVYSTLSAGEKSSLNFEVAKSTIEETGVKVIIFDEPLAHLDERNRKLQLERLRALQESNRAVALIIVSHGSLQELKEGLPRVNVVHMYEDAKAEADVSC